MAVQLENTGERMIPEHHKGRNIYGAHLGRYQAGLAVIKGKIVLDIACGTGYGVRLMASTAQKVYGVDIDEMTIAYAKEHYRAKNVTYKVGGGTAIPLEDSSVDVVTSYETIEHIADYEKFMLEIKRVLKPGGMLLLSTPNDVEYGVGNHFHIHEFTYQELKKLVRKYYKHQKSYFQTLWLYSSILPENLHTTEWEEPIHTTGTCPLTPEQCIYFFLLCSDEEITDEIPPLGVIGEHFRQRDMQAQGEKQRRIRQELKKLQEQFQETTNKNAALTQKLATIQTSKSWKVAKALHKAASPTHTLLKRLRKRTK